MLILAGNEFANEFNTYKASAQKTCTRTIISGYTCKTCSTTYSSAVGSCTKILGYLCGNCLTSGSPGRCTRITSYRCNSCGTTSSSSGSCTNQTSYTYYTMNCGF